MMKNMVRKGMVVPFIAVLMLLTALLCGCGESAKYQENAELDTSEDVRLVIVGNWTDSRGLELAAQKFSEIYPNCKVEYEGLQDYNETLAKRVVSEDDPVDMFITSNIQEGSPNMEYALDLLEYSDELPLTDTFPGMTENFTYTDSDGVNHLYAVPVAGEMRGLYVNTTLLSSLGIDVPTNREELLAACEKLRDAGYVPLQDNPGSFGQRLLFPYMAHLISDADDPENVRDMLASCDEGAADIFKDPMEFLYQLTVDNYYNYKYVETEYNRFLDLSDEGMARSFLNITGSDGAYEKADDLGAVPFMTAADSLMPVIDKTKENYHSKIEYEFILAPVSSDGGYAYMCPGNGIAINKNTAYSDWALEFLNFFFTAENNKAYAETANMTPNTVDALELISEKYDIATEDIGQPADVTFGDYNFFNLINPVLVTTSKANNPKYMQEDGTMYPFDYYMDALRTAFAEQRAAEKE